MKKSGLTWLGLGLIAFGVLALVTSTIFPMFGVRLLRYGMQRIWPSIVVSVGLFLTLLPVVRRRRGLGGLFFPGIPILVTGTILFAASMLNWWQLWEWLWPLEVLAVAASFAAASLYMRAPWLMMPAIIIGANGLLFQFCAITGLWESWAVMWTIEPLSVGLSMLLIGARKGHRAVMSVGLGICALAGMLAVLMLAVLPLHVVGSGWWLGRLIAPGLLIGVGALLVLYALFTSPRSRPQPEEEPDPEPAFETTPELNLR
jgi:hypothetical protein